MNESKMQLSIFDLHLKQILNGIRIPIILINKERRILFQNKAAYEIFRSKIGGGLCYEELFNGEALPDEQKKLFKNGTISSDMHCSFCLSDEAINSKQIINKEVYFNSKYYNVCWSPIDNDSFIGYFLDVTDYKKNEKEIKRSKNFIKTIIDIVPDFIWVKDVKEKYIFINRSAAENLFFAEPEDVIGKTDIYFVKKIRQEKPYDSNYHTFGELCVNSDKVVLDSKKPGRFDEFGNVKGRYLHLETIAQYPLLPKCLILQDFNIIRSYG